MRVALVLALGAMAAAAQPAFDVASVKPSPPGQDRIVIDLGTVRHGEVTLTNATLSECIQFAYGLSSEDEIAGPDWIRDRSLRVDIIAKSRPDTPHEQLLEMTRTLLAERFRLKLHREPRPIPHFELEVAKDGPKLAASQGSAAGSTLRAYGRGRLSYRHLPMDRLAMLLSRQLKEVVIDKTGLTGAYDIDLNWLPDNAPPDAQPLPDIYTALKEQLGLRLEARKTPVEILVVDRAEKAPIGN